MPETPHEGGTPTAHPAQMQALDGPARARALEALDAMPLRFEVNDGQAEAGVRFLARGAGYGVGLTARGAVLSLAARRAPDSTEFDAAVLHFALTGSDPDARLAGLDPLAGRTNYYRGNDPSMWKIDVATFARVRYEQVYAGVDLVYYGSQGELQYDFHVAPGADPSVIRFAVEGADTIALDATGNLEVGVAGRTIRQRRPFTYQEVAGVRREVASHFVLEGTSVRFEVGEYDSARELVIDPTLTYSTWFGRLSQENISDIALDADGNIIVTGHSRGGDLFPSTPGAIKSVRGGASAPGDAFVAKFNPSGSALIFSTLFGGDEEENLASSIAVGGVVADAAGNVLFVGSTKSANFPTTTDADDQTFNEIVAPLDSDGYLTKLSPTGTLVYSTYLGGSDIDFATSVAVDDAGHIYVAGVTYSSTAEGFPSTVTTFDGVIGGLNDAFLVRYDAAGVRQYVTYLGGSGSEYFNPNVDVLVDATNVVFVSGETLSTNFPTVNGVQAAQGGGGTSGDGFLVKLDTSVNGAAGMLYGTYWGGNRDETFAGIARGTAGVVYATGFIRSIDIATTVIPGGTAPVDFNFDAMVVKFDTSLAGAASRVYALRLSGSQVDTAADVGVDPLGRAWVVGHTTSSDLPLKNPYDNAMLITGRPFVAQINASGTDSILLSLAGARNTNGTTLSAVTLNAPGEVYMAGWAAQPGINSNSLELVNPFQSVYGGGAVGTNDGGNSDGVIQKLGFDPAGDEDGDGLPNGWEQKYGLNPLSDDPANGAGGDPDADGRTNAQELADDTHPRGFVITFLAEGATGAFFDTRLAIANPSALPALVLTRFQKSDGTTIRDYRTVPAMRRATIDVETLAGLEAAEFSTLVEADVQVVVDRTLTWDDRGYGSHAERGILTRTATEWYFAEGATHSGFSLFYLIQNPNAQAATVEVRYLRPAPAAQLTKVYTVGPQSRFNIWVNNEALVDPALAGLAASDVSVVMRSTNGVPIIAERAMYLDAPGQPFGIGHESAGVAAPALSWFLAEGATGNYFDMFVLLANPNSSTAQVTVEYLLTNGQTLSKDYTVGANSRANIWVDLEQFPDGSGNRLLADVEVSATVASTNGIPIIVERAMYWPGPDFFDWREGHNSPGSTVTGTRWAVAEGEQGGSRGTETFVLVANTSAFQGQVRATVLFEDGSAAISKDFVVPAKSRFNIAAGAEFPTTTGKRFGMVVESIGTSLVQIVVERALYSNADGVIWAAGTNALATRLQ